MGNGERYVTKSCPLYVYEGPNGGFGNGRGRCRPPSDYSRRLAKL